MGELASNLVPDAGSWLTSCCCFTHYPCSYQTGGLPDAASLRAQYTDIALALLPHVDVFLAETLSTVAEAQAALEAAAQAAPGVCSVYTDCGHDTCSGASALSAHVQAALFCSRFCLGYDIVHMWLQCWL